MEITETKVGSVVIISLHGEATLFTVKPFKDRVAVLMESGVNKIVVDLSAIDMLDSSGIGALISCKSLLKKNQGDLSIASPSDVVRRVLQLTRLEKMLGCYDSHEEAIASFPSV